MKQMKRFLAIILAIAMAMSSVPMSTYATEIMPVQEVMEQEPGEDLQDVSTEEDDIESDNIEESEDETTEEDSLEEAEEDVVEEETKEGTKEEGVEGDSTEETKEEVVEENTTEETEEDVVEEETETELEAEVQMEEEPLEETIIEEEIIDEEETEKEIQITEEISQISKTAAFATNVSNILDAAIFGSDVYGETDALENVFSGVASSGVDYSTVTFAGDTFASDAGISETITNLVQNTLNDTELECIYTYGDNDSESDIEDQTGLMYAGEYYVYGISQTDMEDADNAYTKAVEFLTTMSECDKTKPLFIVSHMPLHESKGDNLGAYMWFAAVSEIAKAMDVVFFWGHNAAEESESDINAYYIEKNGEETFKVEGGDNATPNFTYMNAGYIGANSENPARLGVVTAAWIYEDKMVFQDCNSEGPYTGEYAHNVTVEREFEELTVNTVSCQDDWETIDITATALGIQDISAQYIYGKPNLSDLFTDYVSYQVDLVGYVEGTEVTYTMSLVEEMNTHNLKVIHVDDNGEIEEIEFTFEDDIFTFTTDKDGIFAYGPAIVHVPEDAVLTNLQITNLPTTTKYFRIENSEDEGEDEYTLPLNIADLEVVAEYSNGTDNISKELEWDQFDEFADGYSVTADMTKIGAQNVVITYTYGEVTLTDTYRIVICYQYIEDKDSKVKLEFEVPGVTDVKILEDVKDEKLQTALEGLLTNYVAYDFEFEGYNEGENVSVTLPIPEGVNVPAVYHVADRTYYATAVKDVVNNGDGTITFTANKFSKYVVGEDTVIEVPNPTTAYVNGVQTTINKTVYVLVNRPTADNQYIIASKGSAGAAYALKENTTTGSPITINAAGNGISAPYIENTDETILWNATAGMKFQSESGKYYLRRNYDGGLSFDKTNSTNWEIEDNGIYYLYYYYYRHYLKFSSGYNNNRWSLDWNDNNIYFYEKQMIPTTTTTNGTYSITGNPATISKTVVNGTSVTLGSTLTFTPESGTAVITDTSSTATYTVVGNGDPNGIISGISGNKLTFSGKQGKALVKVSYTVRLNGKSYTVDNYIQVEAQLPHYVVDVVDNGEIVTRNTIVVKSVTNGTTYELDNQVTYETEAGKQTITPGAGTISWQSSNPTVATVDGDGTVSFTGVDGTTTITVMYKVDEHTYVVGTVNFSATQSQYTIPDDGTSDFPEYPNEGAVRFDKTATAVGNFNQTGIAQIELSMTGVPYGGAVDVVLLLDMSGSMGQNYMTGGDSRLEAVKKAAEVFVTTLVKNEETGEFNDNRISVVVFNGAENDRIINITKDGLVSIPDQATLNNIIDTIDGTDANGGTYYSAALAEAQKQLLAAEKEENYNRKQFVVFMSDGQPDSYDNATDKAYAYTDTNENTYQYAKLIAAEKIFPEEKYSTLMKADDVTIYTVGLGISANNDNGKEISKEDSIEILNRISSNYMDEKYAILVEDSDGVDKLKKDFQSIASSIKFAAENVQVEDKITDEFTMIFKTPNVKNEEEQEAFYIEVVDYPLNADHTRDTANMKSLMKLYVGQKNGNMYAASNADGAEFEPPVFTAVKDEKEKGYYNYDAATQTATFVIDGSGTHNMVSGALVTGTSEDNLKISTPYFYYDASTKILQWATAQLSNSELALRYFLYLENSVGTNIGDQIEAGTYKTNEYATLTYDNFLGNECQQTFPVPQVTWNGAQVSYVFYLVNKNGDPVNRAGRVVPFSEAVYVTDVFTQSIVWNDLEESESLEAEFLAQNLLPEVYELYDHGAKYNIHVFEDENAANLNNHFAIGTTSTNNDLKATTYVFNTKSDAEKYSALGTYAENEEYLCKDYNVTFDNNEYTYDGDFEQFENDAGANIYGQDKDGYYTVIKRYDARTVETGFDFSNTTVAFAVKWLPSLSEDTVVIDYGLPAVINVSENDGLASGVVGVRNTKPAGIEINTGQYTTGKVQTVNLSHGTASVENMTSVRYTPKDMQMDAPEVFYYESEVNYYTYDSQNNAVLNTEGMYSSVTVVPATTVYYEDTEVFVKYKDSTSGESYGKWTVEGTENKTAIQNSDRPGADKIGAVLDADNVYGYDSNYTSCDTYSLGSAHKVTVSSAEASDWPTAEFTFTGTAFDIISLTSNTTGTITVKVEGENTGYSKMWFVDTYYGYVCTKNEENKYIKYTFIYGTDQKWHVLKKEEVKDMTVAEGENTKVPAGDNLKPGAQFVTFEENVTWTATTGTENSLYQIPVIKSPELNYDTYTVTIMPRYANAFNHTSESHYDFYLDAIRIYNSAKNSNAANEVYVKDNEGYPEFIEIRENLLEQKNFNASIDKVNGAVFIDGLGTSGTITDYSSYGPNNEVYLKGEQAIAFVLDVKDAAKYASTHIGMKAPQGGTASVNVAALNGKSCTIETNSATELYYDITECVDLSDETSDVIVLTNPNQNGVLVSLTNLKITYKSAPTQNTMIKMIVSEIEDVISFVTANYVALVPEESVEKDDEPVDKEPEKEEPEDVVDKEPEKEEPEDVVDKEPEKEEPEDVVDKNPIKDKEPVDEQNRKEEQNVIEESAGDKVANYLNGKEKDQVAENTLSKEKVSAEKDIKPEQEDIVESEDIVEEKDELAESDEEDILDDMAIEVNKGNILVPIFGLGIVAVFTLFVVLLRRKTRKEK